MVTPPKTAKPKPRIGRPPQPNSRRLAVPVKLNAAERAQITAAAKAAGTTMSGFIRDAALRASR